VFITIRKTIIGVILLCSVFVAYARCAPVGEFQVSLGGFSYHMPHDRKRNEVNYAFGIDYQWSEDVAVQIGRYRNSGDRFSKYAFVRYHPFQLLGVCFGATMGVVDGYRTLNGGDFGLVTLPSYSRQFDNFGVAGYFIPRLKGKDGLFFIGFTIPFKTLGLEYKF